MEEKNSVDGYKTCYIAFLDILGFKNIVNGKTCEDILEIYKKLEHRPFAQIIRNGEDLVVPNSVCLKVMSDSVCIYIEKDVKNALFALIETCALFQAHLAVLEEPIFLRGAIVVGDIYANGDKTFGPGLTKAYLLEEKVAKYPRIIIAGDLVEEGLKTMTKQAADIIQEQLILDSDYFMITNFLRFLELPQIEKLRNYVGKKLSGTSQESYDISIREKYLYMQEYIKDFMDVLEGKRTRA